MNDILKPVLGKQRRQGATIGNIDRFEAKASPALELCQPGLLEPNIIIGVEIVETDNRPAPFEQTTRDMEPDEASGPRHQNRFEFRHRGPEVVMA